MAAHGLVGVLGQVVPHVPPIRDLGRVRSRRRWRPRRSAASPGRSRLRRESLKPRLHGGGLPVRQHVHDVAGVHVDQHRAVHVPFPEGEVVDPEYFRCARHPAPGRAAISRSTVDGCTAMPRSRASRAPARPASSSPNPVSSCRQRHAAPGSTGWSALGLHSRTWPSGTPDRRQRNRRTRKMISTGRPPAAPSATIREYPPCTRDGRARTAGQHSDDDRTTPRSPPPRRCPLSGPPQHRQLRKQ